MFLIQKLIGWNNFLQLYSLTELYSFFIIINFLKLKLILIEETIMQPDEYLNRGTMKKSKFSAKDSRFNFILH